MRSGEVRPDLVDRRLRLVAEADSLAWHGQRAALASDGQRYDELVADRWTVLRSAWEQVVFDQEWVREGLRDTAGWLEGVSTSMQKAA